nr:MAG TPA: Surface protein, mlp lipoprotein family, MEMBRANE PROTEIN [Caudoviricetes sp.]
MKSSDMEKVEAILKKIRRLKVDIRFLNEAKQEGIDDSCVRINRRFYEMDVSIVQTILDKISSELNRCIKELEKLGVEYVDETA